MEILDKNGNFLRGAAKQAFLKKRGWKTEDLELTILSLDDRIDRLERRTKNLPVIVIADLIFGCFAGKLIKPDLVAIAIGGGTAGVGMAVAIARQ
jgi:hypothetical protein